VCVCTVTDLSTKDESYRRKILHGGSLSSRGFTVDQTETGNGTHAAACAGEGETVAEGGD